MKTLLSQFATTIAGRIPGYISTVNVLAYKLLNSNGVALIIRITVWIMIIIKCELLSVAYSTCVSSQPDTKVCQWCNLAPAHDFGLFYLSHAALTIGSSSASYKVEEHK